jgi:CRP/FNR family transcriptional regulator, cyclic AMP receptor protein
MKFASREGAKARTLAVTAPGWYGGIRKAGLPVAPVGDGFSRPASVIRERRAKAPTQGNSASNSTTISYTRGKEIFGPRQGVGLVYIVHSGCVRLYKSLPDGRSINLGLLGPNTVFTQEIDADGLSSGTAAEALVDSTLSIVEADALADLIRRTPELATAVVHGMSKRLSDLQTLTEHLLARDTSVRLAATLLSLARGFGRPMAGGLTAITLPVTHQNLANMIGSNRVTVTRKLVELQEHGAVRSLGRNSIAVDPDRLLTHARAAATA